MVACICHSPLHHQKPDFEGQSVIKASSIFFLLSLRHIESRYRAPVKPLLAESAEIYGTADLPASAAHVPFSILP